MKRNLNRLGAGCNERSGLQTSAQAQRAACELSEGAGPKGTSCWGTAYVGVLAGGIFDGLRIVDKAASKIVTAESAPSPGGLGKHWTKPHLAGLWPPQPERTAGEPNTRRRWMARGRVTVSVMQRSEKSELERSFVTDRVAAYEEAD